MTAQEKVAPASEGARGYRVPEGFSGTLIGRFEAWKGAGIGARQREVAGGQESQRLSLEWRNPSGGVEQPGSGTTSASAVSPIKVESFQSSGGVAEFTVFQPQSRLEGI